MSSRRPEVFVSATSADLRSCRQLIKEALLTLGCVPVEQTNFPPDYRSVRDMLRAKIVACDAVVHLAGVIYGAEPGERHSAVPRRSYTQLEYDLAQELGKPVYIFVSGDDFTYDEHTPETEDKRALQQAHRATLLASATLRYKVSSRDELALKVHELQTSVEHLARELKKSRSNLARGVTVGLVSLFLLGGGLWMLSLRAGKTERQVAQLETELDRQRHYIKSVADVYVQQQSEVEKLKLTDAQKFEQAIAAVAQKEQIPEASLRSGINLFVAAIKADLQANFMDRALAEFAQKNFAAAATNAGQAGNAARTQYLAADKLAARATLQAEDARARARRAFDLQGQACFAGNNFSEAVGAYEAALAATPRESWAHEWGKLQMKLGRTENAWARVSSGPDILQRRARAIARYRAALDAFPRAVWPQDWAETQNQLANALREHASRSSGADQMGLLAEAVAAYRLALEVRTRSALPLDWATSQNNLATALRDQAAAIASGPARVQRLGDAIGAYRAALEVRTRTARPQEWAATQNNLANVLREQAAISVEGDRAQRFADALAAHRAALAVSTREDFPRDWARIQHSLGNTLREQAILSTGLERQRSLAEAATAYGSALEVYRPDDFPQHWAATQNNLATVLREQALLAGAPDRARLLSDAVARYSAALEVRTRAGLLADWVETQSHLAFALRDQAAAATGSKRLGLLREAADSLRECLDSIGRERPGFQDEAAVRRREEFGTNSAEAAHDAARGSVRTNRALWSQWLGEVEGELAKLRTEPR